MSAMNETGSLPPLLLIDDDAVSREVLGMVLEMRGFSVTLAEDGAAALALLDTAHPEVILMDTQMPGLSGLGLIAALRANSTAKIIAISGSDPGEEIRGAAGGFLLKPFEAEDLVALLASAPITVSSPEAKSSSADVIDPAVLGKLKAMIPAKAVREIYAAVAADLKTRLVTLEAALAAGDENEVKRISHSIKGGCAMVGLSGAMEAAARLESGNVVVTLPTEVSQLHFALHALEGMLGEDFPA